MTEETKCASVKQEALHFEIRRYAEKLSSV